MSSQPEFQMIDGEAYMSDVALAKIMGIDVADLRALIEKNRAELEQFGPVVSMSAREALKRPSRDLRSMLLGGSARLS